MRIDVRSGNNSLTRELLTYAEYRVFVAIQARASSIESIAIDVQDAIESHGADCDIRVRLVGARQVRVRSTGRHPAAAIDRAAVRLERVMALNIANFPAGLSPDARVD
jgi:ribosome-associated translation inhibitor RaiA